MQFFHMFVVLPIRKNIWFYLMRIFQSVYIPINNRKEITTKKFRSTFVLHLCFVMIQNKRGERKLLQGNYF